MSPKEILHTHSWSGRPAEAKCREARQRGWLHAAAVCAHRITVQPVGTRVSPLLGSVSVKAMSSSTTPGSSGSFTCSRHWVFLCGMHLVPSVAGLSSLPLARAVHACKMPGRILKCGNMFGCTRTRSKCGQTCCQSLDTTLASAAPGSCSWDRPAAAELAKRSSRRDSPSFPAAWHETACLRSCRLCAAEGLLLAACPAEGAPYMRCAKDAIQ